MQSLVRLLINTRRRRYGASFLASCSTLPASLLQSDPPRDHFASDPKPRPPSVHGLGHSLLTSMLERLTPDVSVMPTFQGWIRDGFVVDHDSISKAVNCLRFRNLHSRALEVMEWVMRERPYKVTELDYCYLLEFTSKCHDIARAEKLFQTIPKSYQNELLYNRLVMSCLDAREIELSYTYMNQMRKLLLPISLSVYNS